MTTVMPFSDDRAFDQLDNGGYVFTFRASRRAEPNGEVWVNRGRGTEGVFYGDVKEVEQDISPESRTLERYSPNSGFRSTDEWRETIRELNGSRRTLVGLKLNIKSLSNPGIDIQKQKTEGEGFISVSYEGLGVLSSSFSMYKVTLSD